MAQPSVGNSTLNPTHLQLMQIFDSVFPIGAFALSNGLETFVQNDLLATPKDFENYLHSYIEVAPYKELGEMHLALQAANTLALPTSNSDFDDRAENLDSLIASCLSSSEIRHGSRRMCSRFLHLTESMPSVQSMPHLLRYTELIKQNRCIGFHPLAVGFFCADLTRQKDAQECLELYGYSLLSALTICAVKSVPLSQDAGQAALNRSFPHLCAAAATASQISDSDIGLSSGYFDVAAMQHETLYSRLYMS